jgi:hypothetical protein
MSPLIAKRDLDPEAEIQKFSFAEIFKSDGQNVHKVLLRLRELIDRLPHVVQANPAYWIERVEKKAGHTILFYMERVLKDDKGAKYAGNIGYRLPASQCLAMSGTKHFSIFVS